MWQRSAGPLRRLRAVLEVDLHRHVRSPFGCQLAVGFLHVRLLAEASMPSLRHERPRPVSALLRRARPRACRKSIDFQTITRCDGLRVFRGGQVGDSVIVREASGDTGQHAGRRWDVALSFAGPQRDYVEQVAQALKARGGVASTMPLSRPSCGASTWLRNCPGSTRASRWWWWCSSPLTTPGGTGPGWNAAPRSAGRWPRQGVYVLPARFDDSELPGLLPDVVTIDLRGYTPAQFADLIVEKLADLGNSPSPPGGTDL